MTEIREYRGKRLDNGEWVYGYICKAIDFWQSECPWAIQVIEQLPAEIDHTIINYCSHIAEVDPKTVGQYTGLKDKDENKIFEGDILLFTCHDGSEWVGKVEFGNPNGEYDWGWQVVNCSGIEVNPSILLWVEADGVDCEIIGNIHDGLKGGE